MKLNFTYLKQTLDEPESTSDLADARVRIRFNSDSVVASPTHSLHWPMDTDNRPPVHYTTDMQCQLPSHNGRKWRPELSTTGSKVYRPPI